MNFFGTKEGVFIVARACEAEGCEAVHVARVPYTHRDVPVALRPRLRAETVRALVRMRADEDLTRDGWILRHRDPRSDARPSEEADVWCRAHAEDARSPHEWPSYALFVAHLAHGGVWRVATPAGTWRYVTRLHNRVPEIRREDRTEWQVYTRSIPRREITITPEYSR